MIREVIVVEGKNDIAAVRRAVDADCLATGGFSLPPAILRQLEKVYRERGLIILTDPDSAGERIRRTLAARFPEARHAFVPKGFARSADDVGIERASPEAIRTALSRTRYAEWQPSDPFSWEDMAAAGLAGLPDAAERRAKVGEMLGIGYANGKQFLYRLNRFGVSRDEFSAAVSGLGR